MLKKHKLSLCRSQSGINYFSLICSLLQIIKLIGNLVLSCFTLQLLPVECTQLFKTWMHAGFP